MAADRFRALADNARELERVSENWILRCLGDQAGTRVDPVTDSDQLACSDLTSQLTSR